MEIRNEADGISVVKKNRTEVNYFIFDEYDIILNKIPSMSAQEWHKHEVIDEVIVVTAGEITVYWQENDNVKKQVLHKNAMVNVKKTIHTIKNESPCCAEFIVFRMVPSGENKRTIITGDKTVYENMECQ